MGFLSCAISDICIEAAYEFLEGVLEPNTEVAWDYITIGVPGACF